VPPVPKALGDLRVKTLGSISHKEYLEQSKKPEKRPGFDDVPIWLKVLDNVAILVMGLCLFVYFTPEQELLPDWTLIPKYPVYFGIACFVVVEIRILYWWRSVRAYDRKVANNETSVT